MFASALIVNPFFCCHKRPLTAGGL
jgi:hypothetical protein